MLNFLVRKHSILDVSCAPVFSLKYETYSVTLFLDKNIINEVSITAELGSLSIATGYMLDGQRRIPDRVKKRFPSP